jgi:hypothetical protein
MVKKIVLGGLLIGLIGFLITGAVVRTNAISGSGEGVGRHGAEATDVANGGQGGNGQGGRWATEEQTDAVRGGGIGGWGQGGNGDGTGAAAQEPLADVAPTEWASFVGTVVSAADDLVEVETETGEIIPFEGRPLSFALEQGFALQLGDSVLLHGFDEDGEFKLGKVDNLETGASVILRDTSGRPGWAGRGGRQ